MYHTTIAIRYDDASILLSRFLPIAGNLLATQSYHDVAADSRDPKRLFTKLLFFLVTVEILFICAPRISSEDGKYAKMKFFQIRWNLLKSIQSKAAAKLTKKKKNTFCRRIATMKHRWIPCGSLKCWAAATSLLSQSAEIPQVAQNTRILMSGECSRRRAFQCRQWARCRPKSK